MFQFQQILVFLTIFVFSQAEFLQQNDKNTKKLNILILYESLCPDSIRFMSTQLDPAYDDLKDFINIQFVPFGKSYSDDNGANFYCQHGPNECAGNRKQSCVLSQTQDQNAQVQFVICAMSTPAEYLKSCAESAGLNGDIQQCMNTQHGTQLQLRAEEITERYSPRFIPTIIYENVFDQELQDSSIRNFRGTVCRLLQRSGIIDINTPKTPCA